MMEDIKTPKTTDYRPIGRRRPGYNSEAEAGHLLA